MKYRANYDGMARFLKGPDARRVTTLAAAAALSRMRATMPRETGATAASGRLDHLIGGRKKDRAMVRVSFGVHAVRHQFGNKRVRASRPMTRGLIQR